MERVDIAVEIYTDGACWGNPGPGGWGAVLRYGKYEKTLCGGEAEKTTNNRMELTAPIEALTHLTRRAVVNVYTDSTYVRDGITKMAHELEAERLVDHRQETSDELGPVAVPRRGCRPTRGHLALGQGPCRPSG